jgi:hypothetical protein
VDPGAFELKSDETPSQAKGKAKLQPYADSDEDQEMNWPEVSDGLCLRANCAQWLLQDEDDDEDQREQVAFVKQEDNDEGKGDDSDDEVEEPAVSTRWYRSLQVT